MEKAIAMPETCKPEESQLAESMGDVPVDMHPGNVTTCRSVGIPSIPLDGLRALVHRRHI
jgi:hypothetical protein